ncbi:MAG: aspartate/glutamate racemase family protein [Proteobacteria bacterium]|nr:aspartate/glutamate racemase family protein [Pseudomonadota bacterium]
MTITHPDVRTALGWRARLGLIVPQLDLISEPLFPKILPDGVSIHTARMKRRGPVSSATLNEMNSNLDAAIDLLPTPYIDAAVYHCTMGSLLADPEKLREQISKRAEVPAITTTASVVKALRTLKVKKVCLVSPYIDELNKAEVEFFNRSGFEVPAIGGAHIEEAIDMASVAPEQITAWVRKAAYQSCDAIFITCTGIRSHEFIASLEEQTGLPVVTSTSATTWEIYGFLKASRRNVPLGRLFELDG